MPSSGQQRGTREAGPVSGDRRVDAERVSPPRRRCTKSAASVGPRETAPTKRNDRHPPPRSERVGRGGVPWVSPRRDRQARCTRASTRSRANLAGRGSRSFRRSIEGQPARDTPSGNSGRTPTSRAPQRLTPQHLTPRRRPPQRLPRSQRADCRADRRRRRGKRSGARGRPPLFGSAVRSCRFFSSPLRPVGR